MTTGEREKVVERKCRWCGRKFKVPPDYPKRTGCPDCQPSLDAQLEPEPEPEDAA
jgi:uncharacterized OB-fold protein